LKVYNDGKSGTIFFKKPNKAGVEISNLGNSFVQPFGKVTVSNMSSKTIYSYEVNNTNPRSIVLPSSKRMFIDPIKNISKPGRYVLNASIATDDGSNVLVAQKTFWYLTGWMLALILVVLVVLILVTLLAYRQYRKSRRHTRKSRR
jgi:membrane protein insertase Oxa1/YidC/SpoIIIJ